VVFRKARNFARARQLTYWFDAFLGTLAISKSQNSDILALEQMQKMGLLIRAPKWPLTSSSILLPPLYEMHLERMHFGKRKELNAQASGLASVEFIAIHLDMGNRLGRDQPWQGPNCVRG